MSTGPYFTVARGAPAKSCRSCNKPVYWITTDAGRTMPVDCAGDDKCQAPTDEAPGLGLSHFATCPHGQDWRRR